MSQNPYQPSQVEQKVSRQSLGLRRILAIAAAYRASVMSCKYVGFRWHHLLMLLSPFALWAGSYILLKLSVFQEADGLMWLMLASLLPSYLFLFISVLNGGVVLSPRVSEPTTQQDVLNSDGVLYASGIFSLKESAVNYNRIFRFVNRLVTGRSPAGFLLRVPCKIKQASELQELVSTLRNDPFDDEQESDPEDTKEYLYAAGKLDPQKEPELVFQHLGFNSEPAVKIYYRDVHDQAKWLILASPDADYLQQTLATLQQSFMITLGN